MSNYHTVRTILGNGSTCPAPVDMADALDYMEFLTRQGIKLVGGFVQIDEQEYTLRQENVDGNWVWVPRPC